MSFGGEALDGLTSRGFDNHSKLFFPQSDAHFVPPTVTEEGIVTQKDHAHRRVTIRRCCDEDYAMNWQLICFIHDGGGRPAAGRCSWQQGNKLTVAAWRFAGGAESTRIGCMSAMNPDAALRRRLETLANLPLNRGP
ncbi:siderophore-interacting protein [Shigella flexneri]